MKYCAGKDNSSNEILQDSAHFCRETLLKRVDSEDLVKQVVKMALADFPQKIEQVDAAILEGNKTDIRGIAHQFKGAALNVCCTLLADIAGTMEQMAIADENLSLLKEKYKELQNEWEIVKGILEK